jgi:hypothetical protein
LRDHARRQGRREIDPLQLERLFLLLPGRHFHLLLQLLRWNGRDLRARHRAGRNHQTKRAGSGGSAERKRGCTDTARTRCPSAPTIGHAHPLGDTLDMRHLDDVGLLEQSVVEQVLHLRAEQTIRPDQIPDERVGDVSRQRLGQRPHNTVIKAVRHPLWIGEELLERLRRALDQSG